MPIKPGWQHKIYRNTGTYGSPTWNEIDGVKDVNVTQSATEDDVTLRRHGGFKATGVPERDLMIAFTMLQDGEDADYVALDAAWWSGDLIDVAAVDGDIETSGTVGVRFWAAVTKADRDESNAAFVRVSFELKPGYITSSDEAPTQWET